MERPPTCLVTLNHLVDLVSIEDADRVINPPETGFRAGEVPEPRAHPGAAGPVPAAQRSSVAERPQRLQVSGCEAAWFTGSASTSSGLAAGPWSDTGDAVNPRDPDGRDPHRDGVLVIEVDHEFYAISFGEGFRRIRDEARDQRFGLRVALRCLARPELVDLVSGGSGSGRIESTPLSDGNSVLWIRPGNLSEIVRRIGGHALPMPLTGQAAGERPARLYGAGGLRLRLGLRAADLVGDLRTITAVHHRPAPLRELAFVDDIAPVSDPRTRHQLDSDIENRFSEADFDESHDVTTQLALMVPEAALPYLKRAVSYRIEIGSVSSDVTDLSDTDLTLTDLIAPARRQPPGARLSALRTGHVSICDLPGGRRGLSGTSAVKWIEATVRLGERQFALLEGVWHEFDPGFTGRVRSQIAELLHSSAPSTLPGWPTGWDEDRYSRHVHQVSSDHLHLPGLELCDLLGPDDELIHVTRARGTADLGRRFARSLAATQDLCDRAATKEGFRRLVQDDGHGRRLPADFHPKRVLIALRLDPGRSLSPETLFPFAQAALAQTATALGDRQVRLDVVGVTGIEAVALANGAENAA